MHLKAWDSYLKHCFQGILIVGGLLKRVSSEITMTKNVMLSLHLIFQLFGISNVINDTSWGWLTESWKPSASWYVSLYLSSVKSCVLCLYTLCLRGKREDHLWLQAQGQLLVVLLLCTVTWSLAVFVLRKQVRFSLHQKLSGGKQEENLVLSNTHTICRGMF